MKKNLIGLTLAGLQQVAVEVGMPLFAAKQMADWLYVKQVSSIDQMTNISLKLRERLAQDYEISLAAPQHSAASTDGTVKYLFPVQNDKFVEAVYIPDDDRATLCHDLLVELLPVALRAVAASRRNADVPARVYPRLADDASRPVGERVPSKGEGADLLARVRLERLARKRDLAPHGRPVRLAHRKQLRASLALHLLSGESSGLEFAHVPVRLRVRRHLHALLSHLAYLGPRAVLLRAPLVLGLHAVGDDEERGGEPVL